MAESLYQEEVLVQGDPALDRVLKLGIPLGLYILYFLTLYFTMPLDFYKMVGLSVAYMLPPAGKETVIPVGIGLGIPWYVMVMVVTFIDFNSALLLTMNFDIALRIPLIGPILSHMMRGGRVLFWKKPWIRRMSTTGLALFVMFPLQGTGGTGASIVGRLMGLKRKRVLTAVTIGSVLGSSMMAVGVNYIKTIFEQSLINGLALVSILILFGTLAYVYKWTEKMEVIIVRGVESSRDVAVDLSTQIHILSNLMKRKHIIGLYRCPHCGTQLKMPDFIEPGEMVTCSHCGVELERTHIINVMRKILARKKHRTE